MDIQDKETVVEIIPHDDRSKGFYCPRCRKRFKKNTYRIRYCSMCGQKVAPCTLFKAIDEDEEVILSTITLDELEDE